MSKPPFSKKRKGKTVDPYPLGKREKGKVIQTKGSIGRPRIPIKAPRERKLEAAGKLGKEYSGADALEEAYTHVSEETFNIVEDQRPNLSDDIKELIAGAAACTAFRLHVGAGEDPKDFEGLSEGEVVYARQLGKEFSQAKAIEIAYVRLQEDIWPAIEELEVDDDDFEIEIVDEAVKQAMVAHVS